MTPRLRAFSFYIMVEPRNALTCGKSFFIYFTRIPRYHGWMYVPSDELLILIRSNDVTTRSCPTSSRDPGPVFINWVRRKEDVFIYFLVQQKQETSLIKSLNAHDFGIHRSTVNADKTCKPGQGGEDHRENHRNLGFVTRARRFTKAWARVAGRPAPRMRHRPCRAGRYAAAAARCHIRSTRPVG